jgi:hypothetical protein
MMSELLLPCPAGHKAGEPHQRGWPERGWKILCFGHDCGWELSGASKDEVISRWNGRTPGPATQAMLKFLASELEFIGSNFHSETVPKGAGYRLRTELLTDNVKAFIDEWKGSGA